MQNPDKLRLAPAAEDLAMLVYDYTTTFPREERYGLAAQMRRAAISVGSNVFEGTGRRTPRAFAASLYVAMGESSELLFQLRIACRRKMGDDDLAEAVRLKLGRVRVMLTRLIARVEANANEVSRQRERLASQQRER